MIDIDDLRAMCTEYDRIKTEAGSNLTHESVARIATVGMKALEVLPELIDYVQKIESAKAQFMSSIVEQYIKYHCRYSTAQNILNNFNDVKNVPLYNNGEIECFGRRKHD